jgi:hypothetical protein
VRGCRSFNTAEISISAASSLATRFPCSEHRTNPREPIVGSPACILIASRSASTPVNTRNQKQTNINVNQNSVEKRSAPR